MVLPPRYKIHPAIGIARLGNAATFFIGPETPGLYPVGEAPGTSVPPYKDGPKIKRQAARFRIFEYIDNGKGQYVVSNRGEVLPIPAQPDVTKMIWTVHLANRKASFFAFNGLVGWDPLGFKDDPGRDRRTPKRRNPNVTNRRNLEIDPNPRSISGIDKGPVTFEKGGSSNPSTELWPNPAPSPEIKTLGELRTDGRGRLLVLGGEGKASKISSAGPISDYANNDGWFDDVSDGPVTAHLEIKKKSVSVEPSWVICAPPDFAPHLTNIVTLYDTMYDVAVRKMAPPTGDALYTSGSLKGLTAINKEFEKARRTVLSNYQPDFATEIYPILHRAAAYTFVFGPPPRGYGFHLHHLIMLRTLASKDSQNKADREEVFNRIRPPWATTSNQTQYMPKLLGDEPYPIANTVHQHQRIRLTMTRTQYALLEQWSKGNFIEPQVIPPPNPTSQNITPEGLDRAALEGCVGGAFFPGIEVGWQVWSSSIYSEPFRIAHGAPSPYIGEPGNTVRAGHFTRQMALPWQADFLQCKTEGDNSGVFGQARGEWGWWPAQRPDWVFASMADYNQPNKPLSRWHRATRGGREVDWPRGFSSRERSVPSYDEMIANWTKFGFIVEVNKGVFIESDRGTQGAQGNSENIP